MPIKETWNNIAQWYKEEIKDEERDRMWHKRPLSAVLLLAGAITALCLCFISPFPGAAVTLLGVAAATMAIVGELRGIEKAAWLLLLFAFAGLELRAIREDKNAQDEIQRDYRYNQELLTAQQLKNFQVIGNGIQTSIKKSDEHFDETTRGIRKSIDTMTGGNSYCVVMASPVGNEFLLNISTIGSSPLHDINVELVDNDLMKIVTSGKASLTVEEISRFTKVYPPIPFLVSTSGRQLGTLLIGPNDKRSFSLRFFSMNGVWSEILQLRKTNGQWEQAVKVVKMPAALHGGKVEPQLKTLYTYATPRFPKKNKKIDWDN